VPTTEIKETGARHGEHLYILQAVEPPISQNWNTTATLSSQEELNLEYGH